MLSLGVNAWAQANAYMCTHRNTDKHKHTYKHAHIFKNQNWPVKPQLEGENELVVESNKSLLDQSPASLLTTGWLWVCSVSEMKVKTQCILNRMERSKHYPTLKSLSCCQSIWDAERNGTNGLRAAECSHGLKEEKNPRSRNLLFWCCAC